MKEGEGMLTYHIHEHILVTIHIGMLFHILNYLCLINLTFHPAFEKLGIRLPCSGFRAFRHVTLLYCVIII